MIATALAAPLASASLPICTDCAVGAGAPPQCLIGPGGTGNCTCGQGLICVGTGPFNLIDVCVGSDLLSQTCGGSTCYGVCLGANSVLVQAIHDLSAGIRNFVANAVAALPALSSTLQTCQTGVDIPTNVCASPMGNDGSARLGVPCGWHKLCTTGALGGTLDNVLTNLLNLVKNAETALGNAGVLMATPEQCQAKGLVCVPEMSLAGMSPSIIGVTAGFVIDVGLGYCGCPTTSTCLGTYTSPCTPANA